jgi:ubiquinone/menaquinone biosynthesis C-methylase UbiE
MVNGSANFVAYFNHLAPDYLKYKKRFAYYWSHISRYINYFISESDSVLEIGCGVGDNLNALKGNRKLGVDISENMIMEARKNFPDLQFEFRDAARLCIDEKFDVIVLSNVLGYMDDIQMVFRSLKSVSHNQTRIIIAAYNYSWEPILKFVEWLGLKKKSGQQNWLSVHDIQNLLYLEGFDVFRKAKRMLLPVNIPLISFFVNKYLARLPLFNHFCLDQFIFARNSCVQKTDYSVSIVIPARNESGNIENALSRMHRFGTSQQIIFVEGNSTDDTWEIINKMVIKYKHSWNILAIKQPGKGKGDAVREAFSKASGDILMILDADLTVEPEQLPKFYEAIAEGKAEFINGSRLMYPMEKNAMRTLNEFGNRFFSAVFSWLLEQQIKDTLCGTKVMFRKDYLKLERNRSFFGDFDPFGDFDLIFGAYKLNLKIVDLPVRYQERVYGTTNISRFKHGWLLLRMVGFALSKIKFW